MKSLRIKKCRLCYSENLQKMGSLGMIAISNFTKRPLEGKKMPLELVWCENCDLYQLAHNPPQNELYKRFYWYESGTNKVIADDLKSIVQSINSIVKLGPGDTWIDLGANDGTLLSFVSEEIFRVGVEPAKNLISKLRQYCHIAYPEFWESKKVNVMGAKVITAIGMFYDSPDPNKFIKKVANTLDKDGIFVAQLMTLEPMLKYNDVGNICHEHLEYYTYKSLVYLYEKNGLEIFNVEQNRINGGSYRLYARKYRIGSVRISENIAPQKVKAFFEKIKEIKKETVAFIKEARRAKQLVYGYGASTKFNTILQYYGLDSKIIRAIADKDPKKLGKYTIKTGIPIILEEIERKSADYFFVGPWGFIDFFINKERQWLQGGGKFIISIPKFKIIAWPISELGILVGEKKKII